MDLTKFTIKEEPREKTAFYASDFNRSNLELYLGFMGVEKTNPPEWFNHARFGAGNGVEDVLLRVLKDSGYVNEDYDQKEHGRIDIEREGITIHGYVDAITKEGLPVEIKSINNKNAYDIREYESGNPRENYVGQLSVYMDALGVDTGYLFVCSVDGLHRFLFECKKVGERRYKCKNVEVDLDKEYKRWSKLHKECIEGDVKPDLFEVRYKYPVKEIDWKTISKDKISKARNNRGVIGDWQVLYSDWKDFIIEKQGVEPGYTKEELEYINEVTTGYTTWK